VVMTCGGGFSRCLIVCLVFSRGDGRHTGGRNGDAGRNGAQGRIG
jgi:hypothetical protein